MEILLFIIAFLLFLIYLKINTHSEQQTTDNRDLLDGEVDIYGQKRPEWAKDILSYLKDISKSNEIISNHFLSKNPAGPKSDVFKKKANLIKIYAEYLVKTEKLSIEKAKIRADFEINVIYRFNQNELIDSLNGGIHSTKGDWATDEEERAIANFYKSKILDKDIDAMVNPKDNVDHIIAFDLFAPLYKLIVKDSYKIGTKIYLSIMDECESVNHYDDFVKNRALITKLEKMKVIIKTNKDGWDGRPEFILTKTNLDELRDIIYGKGKASHDNDFFEERYKEGKLHGLFSQDEFF